MDSYTNSGRRCNSFGAFVLCSLVLLSAAGCDPEVPVGKTYTVVGWCEDGCTTVKVKFGDGTPPVDGITTGETKQMDGKTYRQFRASHMYKTVGDDRDIECSCDGTNYHAVLDEDDDPVVVDVITPENESSDYDVPISSQSEFYATLTPSNVDFSGIQVIERDPGGGTDECWFDGSYYPPADFLTVTGPWTVNAENKYGMDTVGFKPQAVVYYRNAGKAPCLSTVTAMMDVVIPGGDNINYAQNPMSAKIGEDYVENMRDGKTDRIDW